MHLEILAEILPHQASQHRLRMYLAKGEGGGLNV